MQQKLCPIDGTPLVEMVKNGVTIDVCPECKGVWLDRGELEKLINVALEMEREYGTPAPRAAPPAPSYDAPQAARGYDAPPQPRGYEAPPQPRGYDAPKATRGYDATASTRGYRDDDRDGRSTKDSDEWYENGDRRYPKKKKSALGRIFDIFD